MRCEGQWRDICSFAETFEDVMEDNSVDEEEIQEYDEWRPKEKENVKDISEKTADKACVQKTKVEEDYNGAKEELGKAGKKIKKGVTGKEPTGKNIKEATKNVERLFEAGSIRSIRKLEKMIYQGIMLKFNPCYFDTEDFSVNLEKSDNGEEKNYKFSVNISDEELREKVRKELKERTNN